MRLATFVGTYAVLSTAGLLLLRSGVDEGSGGIRAALLRPHVLIGLLVYAASFVVWLAALRRYELSSIYPLFIGVGYSAVFVSSVLLLGERLTLHKAAGVAMVGVGVLLLVK